MEGLFQLDARSYALMRIDKVENFDDTSVAWLEVLVTETKYHVHYDDILISSRLIALTSMVSAVFWPVWPSIY